MKKRGGDEQKESCEGVAGDTQRDWDGDGNEWRNSNIEGQRSKTQRQRVGRAIAVQEQR